MASGSSRLSGAPASPGRPRSALRTPPSMTKCATWMPLRLQLARHRLGEAAQRELAHGEGRRLGVALHAGRGAGEEDRAAPRGHHAPRRLLADEEAAEGRDLERLRTSFGIEVEERAAGAEAGIVEHDVERAERAVDLGEQRLDGVGLGGVGGDRTAPVSLARAASLSVLRAESATL